jgi:hypothetical protein
MKSIKDLREQYDLITEKEEAETKKLAALVRAGLFDAKKLTSLKRALDKPVDKMTAQEKRMLLNLLDALMSEVLSNQPVYQKVKQNVMMKEEVKDYLSKLDPRYGRGWPTSKEAPGTLLLKRKAIRVFPDGQKVALYYAQAIDKYVSIPYGEIGINENWLTAIVRGAARVLSGGNSSDDTAKKDEDEVAKELKPLEREKAKLNISADEKKPYMTGTEARQRKAERDANITMARGSVSENFRSKLQALNEYSYLTYDSVNRGRPKDRIHRGWGDDDRLGRRYVKPEDKKPDLPKETPKEQPKTNWKDIAKNAADNVVTNLATGAARRVGAPVYAFWKGLGVKPAGSEQEREWELSNVKRQEAEKSSKAQNWPGAGTTGLGDIRPKTKVEIPLDRPIGSLPKAKADSKGTTAFTGIPTKSAPADVKGTTAFTGMPTKSAPAKSRLPQAPKNPNTNIGITTIDKPDDGSESEIEKRMKSGDLPSATSGVGAAPSSGAAPAAGQKPSSGAAPAPGPGAAPKSVTAPAPKPSPAPGSNVPKPKPKPDEEGEPKPPPPPKKPFKLPIVDVGATALTSLTPGLKLNLSGPKREGDADAIRSRMAGIERKAWQAQAAAMKESVEINLNGNQFVLNNKEADKVLSLYESLNAKNKQKMIKMMNESEEQLNKIISFAVRQ